ncbi:MAG: hypothetical protein ACKO5E_21585 [bacterium]
MKCNQRIFFLATFCIVAASHAILAADFTKTRVITPEARSKRFDKAVQMLTEEVNRRTRLHWQVNGNAVANASEITILTNSQVKMLPASLQKAKLADKPEGYAIYTSEKPAKAYIIGFDDRGVLFGIGRMLRELHLTRDRAELAGPLQIVTSPATKIRGHQLGYRPKTNSYDAWDIDRWEQYYRDLIAFGTNAVELIPPRSDDDADSLHFPRPQLEMMILMSKLADDYGIDLWIWYPAIDGGYEDPAQVEFALKEWAEIFKVLPKIDVVFVPGGDPGHMRPVHMMNLLEKQAVSLKKYHPDAEMWMSPQSFDRTWTNEFIEIMKKEPKWLGGIVYGPQNLLDLKTLRETIPARYPIRGYPDITHNLMAQHPVTNWDFAFALTQGREAINPRPYDQAAIFRFYQPHTAGFISYSEGCNDDVNKFIWSGLGWDPAASVKSILKSYSRYLISAEFENDFAEGLIGLEKNWQGPLLANSCVENTLLRFQQMERAAPPDVLRNWRFQQALYRACYDAWLRQRLIAETAKQHEAESVLRQATLNKTGPFIEKAIDLLQSSDVQMVASEVRNRVNELADSLFQTARMQLATVKYHGKPGRGTSQDQIDVPLNDRPWLVPQLKLAQALPTEKERLDAVSAILNRTNPGPGGFYDDLGNPAQQPHLVQNLTFADDPEVRRGPFNGFEYRLEAPIAWCRYAQTMYDQPILMRYTELDKSRKYKLRVTYAGDNFRIKIQFAADGRLIHPPIQKPNPHKTLEFEIPPELTADGRLELQFNRDPGVGGNGRGCQVAEVWLVPVD